MTGSRVPLTVGRMSSVRVALSIAVLGAGLGGAGVAGAQVSGDQAAAAAGVAKAGMNLAPDRFGLLLDNPRALDHFVIRYFNVAHRKTSILFQDDVSPRKFCASSRTSSESAFRLPAQPESAS